MHTPNFTTLEVTYRLGDIIKHARTERGLSLQDLYKMTGISASVISDLENYKGTVPTLHTVIQLSFALEIPLSAFFKQYEDSSGNLELQYALIAEGLKDKDREHVLNYINFLKSIN